jgi:hypothetical protein
MNTELITEPNKTVFLQTVVVALNSLKQQLQHDYEQAYPALREIIRLVLDEQESRAWDLTLFPHLLLPDLVEAHIDKLGLQPVAFESIPASASPSIKQYRQLVPASAYANC